MGVASGPPPMGYQPMSAPTPSKSSSTTIIALFVGGILAVAVLAIVYVLLSAPTPPEPPCQPGQICDVQPSLPPVGASPTPRASVAPTPVPATLPPGATPTPFVPAPTPVSNSPIVLSGEVWQSATLNYSFEYIPDYWQLTDQTDDTAIFSSVNFDAQAVIHAVPATTTPAELIARDLAQVDTFMISRVKDTDDYDALLGPSIGYVNGEGDVYSGTLLGNDGNPVAPGGVTILAATDGRLTVSVVIIVGSPDAHVGSGTHQHAARSSADDFLKTFDWDTRQ
jgi:hypothetical protein